MGNVSVIQFKDIQVFYGLLPVVFVALNQVGIVRRVTTEIWKNKNTSVKPKANSTV